MVYDDNEEEYEDFYDYTALDGEDDAEGAASLLRGILILVCIIWTLSQAVDT